MERKRRRKRRWREDKRIRQEIGREEHESVEGMLTKGGKEREGKIKQGRGRKA